MGATSPQSLTAAGSLLVAAGFVAGFTGGLYGLQNYSPGLVVLSVLLVMGYSVAGYLLLARKDAAYPPAAAIGVVLLVATLGLYRPGVAEVYGREFTLTVVFPLLAGLLTLAAAHLAAYGLARRHGRTLWPPRGGDALAPLLQVAALAPVWSAFFLLHVDRARLGSIESNTLIVLASAAGVASAAGGTLAAIKRHPRFALGGGAIGFLASVAFLFEFSARGGPGIPGQLASLAGMLLAGFPIVMSVIAWVELEGAKRDARHATREPSPPAPRVP